MGQSTVRLGYAALLVVALAILCSSPAQADDAAAQFKTKCAVCHSPDGSGSSPTGKAMNVPDMRAAGTQKKSDADLDGIVTAGKNKMPAFKDKLTADQIKDLVAVIRGMAKK